MTIRKPIYTLTLLLVLSLLLAACTGTSTPVGQPAEDEAVQEEATEEEATEEETTEEETTTDEGAAAETTGELIMLDWAGYEIPEFWTDFKEKYPNVNVEYSFLSDSLEVYSKLTTGFDADLVHPCSNLWGLLVEKGLMQPIDTSKLSNWDGVAEPLAEEGQFDGEQYFVPWDWGYESILVRTDLVEEVPDSWADLWDPQYAGKISLVDSAESAHVFAALALGLDPWETTPEEDEQIRQKLLELAPNILTYWAGQSEVDQLLAAGDVWLGAGVWNASYVSLLEQGYDVEYIVPEEGRTGFLCGFGIPASSENVDLAHEMIDAYLAPEAGAYLANEYGYGAANLDALPQIDPEMATLLGLDDFSALDQTVFYEYMTDEQRETWTSAWSEVKASQ